MLRVVVFDLDGTLMDTKPGVAASLVATAEHLGKQVPADDQIDRFIGPPARTGLANLFELEGAALEEALGVFRSVYLATGLLSASVYGGVTTTLDLLCRSGLRLAVATSKPEPYARRLLEHVGLLPRFEAIAGASLDGAITRKSSILTNVLSRISVPPHEAVLVGDRQHDMRGAWECGAIGIGAGWGYGSTDELLSAGATEVVAHPKDLIDVLHRRGDALRTQRSDSK